MIETTLGSSFFVQPLIAHDRGETCQQKPISAKLRGHNVWEIPQISAWSIRENLGTQSFPGCLQKVVHFILSVKICLFNKKNIKYWGQKFWPDRTPNLTSDCLSLVLWRVTYCATFCETIPQFLTCSAPQWQKFGNTLLRLSLQSQHSKSRTFQTCPTKSSWLLVCLDTKS